MNIPVKFLRTARHLFIHRHFLYGLDKLLARQLKGFVNRIRHFMHPLLAKFRIQTKSMNIHNVADLSSGKRNLRLAKFLTSRHVRMHQRWTESHFFDSTSTPPPLIMENSNPTPHWLGKMANVAVTYTHAWLPDIYNLKQPNTVLKGAKIEDKKPNNSCS